MIQAVKYVNQWVDVELFDGTLCTGFFRSIDVHAIILDNDNCSATFDESGSQLNRLPISGIRSIRLAKEAEYKVVKPKE